MKSINPSMELPETLPPCMRLPRRTPSIRHWLPLRLRSPCLVPNLHNAGNRRQHLALAARPSMPEPREFAVAHQPLWTRTLFLRQLLAEPLLNAPFPRPQRRSSLVKLPQNLLQNLLQNQFRPLLRPPAEDGATPPHRSSRLRDGNNNNLTLLKPRPALVGELVAKLNLVHQIYSRLVDVLTFMSSSSC